MTENTAKSVHNMGYHAHIYLFFRQASVNLDFPPPTVILRHKPR